MDWKEFLKPTKPKLLVFVIVLALSIIYTIFIDSTTSCLIDDGASFCYGTPSVVQIFLFWPVSLAVLFLSQMGTITANVHYEREVKLLFRVLIFIFGVVVNMFYFYVISTLILKVIEKFKK